MGTDTTYDLAHDGRTVVLTIERPERLNALRAQTVDELIDGLKRAWADTRVRSVVLTGAGDRAFSAGGDVKQWAESGDYGPSRTGRFEILSLYKLIRELPVPVIAAVNGLAIGGGHVLQVVCDISLAAQSAQFGQVGPRTGSFDAGLGTAYLARVVGEKRAREMWFFCRQIDAQKALSWGLVNEVVPDAELMSTALTWAADVNALSPTAVRMLKHSFNADTDHQLGFMAMSKAAADMYYQTSESSEGRMSFTERRSPSFPDRINY
ncbi:enoyl-CoA hydratase-related protein [Rhodococcus aetherivorans]